MSVEYSALSKAKELIEKIFKVLGYYAKKGYRDESVSISELESPIENWSKNDALEIIEDCKENVASWICMIANDYEFGDGDLALDVMLSKLTTLTSSISELLNLEL